MCEVNLVHILLGKIFGAIHTILTIGVTIFPLLRIIFCSTI